jgi:hypothetical protein
MNELRDKARRRVYRPLPHNEKLFGWRLDTSHCFAQAGGYDRSDFGGHQCSKKPKYHVNGLQFCTTHAKELSPDLSGLEPVTKPLYVSKFVRPAWDDALAG